MANEMDEFHPILTRMRIAALQNEYATMHPPPSQP